jgi:cytochrome c-type biogenesis protein CcmH
VLLRPPLQWHTLLLWGLPPTVLLGGMIGLLVIARRRKIPATPDAELSDTERRRLSTLVDP